MTRADAIGACMRPVLVEWRAEGFVDVGVHVPNVAQPPLHVPLEAPTQQPVRAGGASAGSVSNAIGARNTSASVCDTLSPSNRRSR